MFTKLVQRSWIEIEVARCHCIQERFWDSVKHVKIQRCHIAQWDDGLKRSEMAGMPSKTASVQDDPTWRTTQVKFLLSCWMMIADGVRPSKQRKSECVTELCSTFCTTFWVTETLSALWISHEISKCNNGTAMQSTGLIGLVQKGRWRHFWTNRRYGETWACSYTPNLKRQSNEWKHPGYPRPKKARPTQFAVKMMFIVAYDTDGVILHHVVPPRQTVNAAYYCTFLQHHLCPAPRRKWHHLVVQNPIILHNNAGSHTPAAVTDLLCRWQ